MVGLFYLIDGLGFAPTKSRFDNKSQADESMPVSEAKRRSCGEANPLNSPDQIKKPYPCGGLFYLIDGLGGWKQLVYF